MIFHLIHRFTNYYQKNGIAKVYEKIRAEAEKNTAERVADVDKVSKDVDNLKEIISEGTISIERAREIVEDCIKAGEITREDAESIFKSKGFEKK